MGTYHWLQITIFTGTHITTEFIVDKTMEAGPLRTGLHEWQLFFLQRRHVDGEAVLHIGLHQSFVRLVDLLDPDDLNV